MQTADQRIQELQDDNSNQAENIKTLEQEVAEWELRHNQLVKQISEFEDRFDALHKSFNAIDIYL